MGRNRRLICDGRVLKRLMPQACTFRIPFHISKWLDSTVCGNKSYLVVAMIELSIAEINMWMDYCETNRDAEDWIEFKRERIELERVERERRENREKIKLD